LQIPYNELREFPIADGTFSCHSTENDLKRIHAEGLVTYEREFGSHFQVKRMSSPQNSVRGYLTEVWQEICFNRITLK